MGKGPAVATATSPAEAVHNVTRAEVGVPPLKWDNRLAADAETWARHLAQMSVLQHWGSYGAPNNGEGENLWMGSRGAYPVEQMTGHWVNEKTAVVIMAVVTFSSSWSGFDPTDSGDLRRVEIARFFWRYPIGLSWSGQARP